jgi:hypothetical protein
MSSAYGDQALQSPAANAVDLGSALTVLGLNVSFGKINVAKFSTAATTFFGKPVFSGAYAWGPRAIGNIDRPTYPDGIDGTPNGPLSFPANENTPFSDGLQLDLVLHNVVQHLLYTIAPGAFADTPHQCTDLPPPPGSPTGKPVLADGLQIFPGGFPVYRNGVLVGGVGISGDGVDQDDMTAFLGVYNGGLAAGTGIGEAPVSIRANNVFAHGAAPHYVNCPYAPYVDSTSQNLCAGK